MIRVHMQHIDLNVDINWVRDSKMRAILSGRGAQEWYILSHGEIVHDPNGLAKECQQLGLAFFRSHPTIANAWKEQEEVLYRKRLDPTLQIQHPKWSDFSKYLSTL